MKTRDDYWKALRLAILALMAEDDGDEAPSWVSFVALFGQGWRSEYISGPTGLEITGMNTDMCRHISRGWLIPRSWEDAAKAAQEDREELARKCGVLPPTPWYR